MWFPRQVNMIGIELEGGFDWPDREETEDATYMEDGSVYMDRSGQDDDLWVGECISTPIRTWTELASWVKEYFPTLVNETCGTHMHISFKSMSDACRLADSRVWVRRMNSNLMAWAEEEGDRQEEEWIKERCNGYNRYCGGGWSPREQLTQCVGDRYADIRYTQVNWHSWHRHGTMEVRVLPGFKSASRCLSAMEIVLNSLDFSNELEDAELDILDTELEMDGQDVVETIDMNVQLVSVNPRQRALRAALHGRRGIIPWQELYDYEDLNDWNRDIDEED